MTVAVVDTGVEPDHPDLLPNLLNTQGYNFWNHTVSGSDGYGHGTLVAGIVGAAAGNGGYVGVAPQARILPVKIMGPRGEFSERAAVARTMFAIRAPDVTISPGAGTGTPSPGCRRRSRRRRRPTSSS